MTLIGLDLNSTRARAVRESPDGVAAELRLGEERPEFPLALSLEGRTPEAGAAGAALARRSPHLACLDFLPHLGTDRGWAVGRLRVDAARALAASFEALGRRFGKGAGLALTVPPYLTPDQRALLAGAAERARWRLLGTLAAPVAAALAAYERLPWSGQALVLDVDGHGMTWSAVAVADDRARLVGSQTAQRLGRGAWLRRMLEGVARRCIRISRRDPRESPDAEQSLYDQLADLTSSPAGGRVELVVRTPQWYQNLMLDPEELQSFCAPLVGQALAALQPVLDLAASHGPVAALLVTADAGRLPGLPEALEERLGPAAPAVVRVPSADADFGEGLLLDEAVTSAPAHLLPPDALARAAHDFAMRVLRGDLPAGHREEIPLRAPPAPDRGAARLHFRGQDHPLRGPSFTLGRDPACDLILESELYPTVSGRHCEIVRERRGFVLHDRSRHGTLVNDSPVARPTPLHSGDWIRLGPSGPLVRFLGQAAEHRPLMTTA